MGCSVKLDNKPSSLTFFILHLFSNNPAPLNDGAVCEKASEQFRECTHSCRLDGAWGQWEAWSRQCDANCQRERKRKCVSHKFFNAKLIKTFGSFPSLFLESPRTSFVKYLIGQYIL